MPPVDEEALGVLHPGEMGASVGAAALAAGSRVYFASEGRSETTRKRAHDAELVDAGSLESLAGSVHTLISVCPPHAALAQARAVARTPFRGVYVDANAVSPETARKIAGVIEAVGARFVDGGIVGPPAWRAGSTTLWLSGKDAQPLVARFESSPLAVDVLEGGPGAASALKLAFAAWTKGTAALLLAIRALARREGVEAGLLEQWSRSVPDLPARSEGAARGTAPKAWRFVGEMNEIADAFQDAGLPAGFHRAAAELFSRLEAFRGAKKPAELEDVLRVLLADEPGSGDARPRDRADE